MISKFKLNYMLQISIDRGKDLKLDNPEPKNDTTEDIIEPEIQGKSVF